jgi:hypothetical protein
MDSPPFLHMQHHSTTATFLFLKLSSVNIFFKAVVHKKKATREGALPHQILFQGKGDPFGLVNTLKHDSTSILLILEVLQSILSTSPCIYKDQYCVCRCTCKDALSCVRIVILVFSYFIGGAPYDINTDNTWIFHDRIIV